MSDSSDESGPEGAGLVQNDASDSESSGSNSGAENGDGTGFLDVEASESLDGDASDSGSDDESILDEGRRRAPRAFFPEFRRLPIELRHRIWQFFCPDLALFPRVLSFQVVPSPKQDSVWESATLENQIVAPSAMLAIHHESRELALKAFPDTLAIREGRRLVRFHKQRDVVHLNNHKKNWRHNMNVPGFSENVINLAMDTDLDPWDLRLLLAFPNVKNVFDFSWHNERRIPHRLRWCASDKIHRYEIEQLQRNVHVGEDLHFIYCWPDVEKHRDFALEKAAMMERFEAAMTEVEEIREERPDFIEEDELARLGEIDYWQMTCFGWDAADRFEAFVAKHGVADGDMPAVDDSSDDEENGSDDSDDSSDQNEYESEGIDDATIDGESGDEDEDEDDLVIDTRQASDDEDDEGGASDFGGFSPLRDEDGGMMVDGSGPAAHFSSPEPESGDDRPRLGGRRARRVPSSEDEEESGEGEVEEPSRGASRRRAVVLSDDDEEKEDDEGPSRNTGRRGRVVLSDEDEEGDEDEEAKPVRPSGRRARVLPSDDDDDEDEDDEGGVDVQAKGGSDDGDEQAGTSRPLSLAEKLARNRRENPVSDGEDSEEDESAEEEEEEEDESAEEEEEEEDGPVPPERMSLAQRLMTHRKRNPIESESGSDGGSEGSVVGSEDELDDDEDDESEEEEDDENGMFMSMADEGESDDEGDEEEY